MPASLDDILTAIKGATQNLSNLTIAFGSPGRTSQSFTTSPVASYFNSIASAAFGTQPFQVVAFNANRRAISFHSCDPMGNTTLDVQRATRLRSLVPSDEAPLPSARRRDASIECLLTPPLLERKSRRRVPRSWTQFFDI